MGWLINLIIWLVVGGIIGWIASMIMRTDAEQGWVMNVVVGIVGAFLGGIIFWFLPGSSDNIASGTFSIWSLVVSLVCSCGGPRAIGPIDAGTAGYPVTLENCGRTVTVKAPPQRAVSINQPASELLLALGLADRMAGTASWSDGVRPDLAADNAKVPVLVDAGVGTASDAAIAMELGCDGVLMNTAIAAAQNPILMASAMKKAVEAGREAYLAGRMPRKRMANASSPETGYFFK